MADGMETRLKAIERKLGITDEQETRARMLDLINYCRRLEDRIDRLERTIKGSESGAAINGVQAEQPDRYRENKLG